MGFFFGGGGVVESRSFRKPSKQIYQERKGILKTHKIISKLSYGVTIFVNFKYFMKTYSSKPLLNDVPSCAPSIFGQFHCILNIVTRI